MNVDFIYFDVGGVVILDFSKTEKWNQMLQDLAIPQKLKADFEELFSIYEPHFCDGEDIEVFVDKAKRDLGIRFPENYSMIEDFVNRFEINYTIHDLLKSASNKYRVGLLTNMYKGMFKSIESHNLLPDIQWDVIIDSSIEGISKPDERIFELAAERAGVLPEKILFVENTSRNLIAAAKMGWQTFEYDPALSSELSSDLAKIIGL